MTTLSLELLRKLQSASPNEAWAELFSFAWETCSPELSAGKAASEVSRRDRAIAPADLFLATAGWDLWSDYYNVVPRTAERLAGWWSNTPPPDALSWFSMRCRSVKRRGLYMARHSAATQFTLRSPQGPSCRQTRTPSLKPSGSASARLLKTTEPAVVTSCKAREPTAWTYRGRNVSIWSMHRPTGCCGITGPTSESMILIHRGTGSLPSRKKPQTRSPATTSGRLLSALPPVRRLVITGDHGYAATGLFPDTADSKQAQHLKARFKSGRSAPGDDSSSDWVPPIDVILDTPHGRHAFALGRRKWKSQGGYPTLAHGGLSLLEVAVPFIQLSRPAGS